MLTRTSCMQWLMAGIAVLLASCADTSSEPAVGLEIPSTIREARNIDQQAITAIVTVGDRRISLTRDGDRFTGAISIPSGTELSYVLEISEQVGGDSVVLAQMTGTRQITNDTAINLFRNQYTYPDTDADGYNNLAEREAGSDYANSISTPSNISGSNIEDSNPGLFQFSSGNYSVSEERGSLQISVTRSGGTAGAVGVSYRLSNETAIAGQDFAANSGQLLWADGDAGSKIITIDVFTDSDFEGNQTFAINLYAATGGAAIGNGFARINIEDSTPVPSWGTVQVSDNAITVDESERQATVFIERVGGSDGTITVEYLTADGSAIGGEDYTAIGEPRTLTWSNGDSTPRPITINIAEDVFTEPNESFSLTLQNARGGATLGASTTVVTIVDTTVPQPQYGAVSMVAEDLTVTEGSDATITVQRRNGTDGAVSVQYSVSPGSATESDYQAQSGELLWADGSDELKTIVIPVLADSLLEDTETFTVNLFGISGGAQLQSSVATIAISDATTVEFGQLILPDTAGAVDEGQSVTIEVTREGAPNSALSLAITFDEQFSDVIELSRSELSWGATETGTQSFTVSAVSNTVSDDPKLVTISLAADDATGISSVSYALTINDVSRPGYIETLPTDAEWEVCLTPYSSADATAFSTQPSALTGVNVTCIKACPDTAAVDQTFTGWGWNGADQHSCTFTDAAPGTIARVPIYLPQREDFTLALTREAFIGDDITWSCLIESRVNSATPFSVDTSTPLWLQFRDDGTYSYDTADEAPTFTTTALWNVAERFLSLGHTGQLFRNVKVIEDAETFFLYNTSDVRLRCIVSSDD